MLAVGDRVRISAEWISPFLRGPGTVISIPFLKTRNRVRVRWDSNGGEMNYDAADLELINPVIDDHRPRWWL